MRDPLVALINAALTRQPISENFSEEDWQRCYDMALQQNVLAMTFSAMTSLPKELRPSFTLWSKWMAYAQNVEKQSEYKFRVVKKMGSWLDEDDLRTILIKGFSLSTLYPNPNLREFSDIDIFSGLNYDAVNDCFAKHGVNVSSVDGHHAYLKVDGISVEHHFAFHNTKVKCGLEGPEDDLQQLALDNPQPTSIPGIYFPSPDFTVLFVGWHAYEHFLQEKIELRHLIDWVLALRALTPSLTVDILQLMEGETWSLFADTMTSLGIEKLGLPKEWFPHPMREASEKVPISLSERVWNDIINAPHTPKSKFSQIRRLYIAKRVLKNSWKFKEFADISAMRFLMKEIVEHIKKR